MAFQIYSLYKVREEYGCMKIFNDPAVFSLYIWVSMSEIWNLVQHDDFLFNSLE